MKTRKGQEYIALDHGWRCKTLSGVTKRGVILVRWLTGPLKDREARIEAASLKAEVRDDG